MENLPPPRDHPNMKSVKRYFLVGNLRGNENPMLLSLQILWARNHNRHAMRLAALHPDWDDDTLFNHARQRNIAEYQHIILNKWLPAWTGVATVPPYTGWDATINPRE